MKKEEYHCDLCKNRYSERNTIVYSNAPTDISVKNKKGKEKVLWLCDNCRREVIIQLLKQYFLEHDMQPGVNDLLNSRIDNLFELCRTVFDKYLFKNNEKEKTKNNKKAGKNR